MAGNIGPALNGSTLNGQTITSPTLATPALTGNVTSSGKVTSYNGVTTAGYGLGMVVASARQTGLTATSGVIATYTVGASDGTFLVSANVLVTTATAHTFTVTVAYTDESNSARTLTVPVVQLAGTVITAITNITGAGPYEGTTSLIRCKAGTAINILTAAGGTYTTVVYNIEGLIIQVA